MTSSPFSASDTIFPTRQIYHLRAPETCLLQKLRNQYFLTLATFFQFPAPDVAFTFHRVGFQSAAEIHYTSIVDTDLVHCIGRTQLHELPQVHYCAAKVPFMALSH